MLHKDYQINKVYSLNLHNYAMTKRGSSYDQA